MRVNDGYERTRRSSRVTSTGARAVRDAAAPAGAPATSVGTTRPTKDSGTSHTPRLTRTGASSITGLPLTSTWAQFRVRVTTLSRVRRWARVLAGVASSFVWSEAATLVSSTYVRPSWMTVGRPVPAKLVDESRSAIRAPARPRALMGEANSNNGIRAPGPLTSGGRAPLPRMALRSGRGFGRVRGAGPHHREHDEADRDPGDFAGTSHETEGDRRGGREPQRHERGQEAALEDTEAGRDQEGRVLDRRTERLDHGGGRERHLTAEKLQDEPGLKRAEEPGGEVKGDRERQPLRRRPVELSEGVVDLSERRAPPGGADAEPAEQPARPPEQTACLHQNEQGESGRLDGQQPEHAVEEERPTQDRAPRHHDAQEEKKPLGDRDRRLGDDDRGEARVERGVSPQEPGLDRLSSDGGWRRQVEGLAGEPRREQGSKGDALAQEGEAPSERVEQRHERDRKAEDDHQSPGEIGNRAEDRSGVVLDDQRGEQRQAEHEEGDAKVAQLSFPDRARGRPRPA